MLFYILQPQHALLLACAAKGEHWFCLVRVMEKIEINDEQITNDYDCPLLSMSTNITYISPHNIFTSVSIVHECTNTCTFVESHATRRVDREVIEEARTSLIFNHTILNFISFFSLAACMNTLFLLCLAVVCFC